MSPVAGSELERSGLAADVPSYLARVAGLRAITQPLIFRSRVRKMAEWTYEIRSTIGTIMVLSWVLTMSTRGRRLPTRAPMSPMTSSCAHAACPAPGAHVRWTRPGRRRRRDP